MQVSDMKSLRTIFSSHKHFLISKNPKSQFPSLISCRSLINPKSSFFHSTSNLNTESPADNAPENGKNRNVWTHYDPITSKLITQRVQSSRGDGNEAESSSGDQTHLGSSKIPNGVEAFSDDKTFGSVKKVNLGSGSLKKTKKTKVCWVCSDCGHSQGQWWGICRSCDKVGTLKEFSEGEDNDGGKTCGYEVSERVMRSWLPNQASEIYPMKLTDVNRGINNLDWRIPLDGHFGNEVARVLGGGLVPGSLVLVGGDPGVGKSTLLLQIAAILAEGRGSGEPKPAPVVYVSGEESVEQIGNRADRLKIGTDHLFLYSSTDIEDILEKIQRLTPRALIIDSIQTVYLKGVAGSTGGIVQVKECTSALLRFSKKTGIPILLIGHVNKNGEVAGPRVLEHIVDVVLYLEGEKCSSHRLLRPVKNRFGSTDELGVFEMLPSGLQTVSNPSRMFLREHDSNSEFLAGLAVAVIMDGTRTFLVEIQALCVSKSSASRHVNGIQPSKADMIISVLMKQAGLKLQENVIFLNVVSGVTLTETAGDLAVAMAICSSFLEFPIPYDMAFIGEIGLGGELRMVSRMEKRINTVAKLGFKRCVIPKSAEDCLGLLDLGEMKLIGCINLKDAINSVYMVRDEATRLQSSVG